jgi:hypothetical protein
VTFLMDDIDTAVLDKLVDPKDLRELPDGEPVDGLLVGQHRYYWPMRDLMTAEVLAISSMDISIEFPCERAVLERLVQDGNAVAKQYIEAAADYYDRIPVAVPRVEAPLDKAMEVRTWIRDAISFRRFKSGRWQPVAFDPSGYRALLHAVAIFEDLKDLGAAEASPPRWYLDTPTPPYADSFLAVRAVQNLLGRRLPAFEIQDDPAALSGILEVRERRKGELRAFREALKAKADQLHSADPDQFLGEVQKSVSALERDFQNIEKALSGRWRVPKLVFREGAVYVIVGLAAGLGALVGGPAGIPVGGVIGGALGEGVKAIFSQFGQQAGSLVAPKEGKVESATVYLFHAERSLRKRRERSRVIPG